MGKVGRPTSIPALRRGRKTRVRAPGCVRNPSKPLHHTGDGDHRSVVTRPLFKPGGDSPRTPQAVHQPRDNVQATVRRPWPLMDASRRNSQPTPSPPTPSVSRVAAVRPIHQDDGGTESGLAPIPSFNLASHSASDVTISCRCPAVSRTASGLPRPSHFRWIWFCSPPAIERFVDVPFVTPAERGWARTTAWSIIWTSQSHWLA